MTILYVEACSRSSVTNSTGNPISSANIGNVERSNVSSSEQLPISVLFHVADPVALAGASAVMTG